VSSPKTGAAAGRGSFQPLFGMSVGRLGTSDGMLFIVDVGAYSSIVEGASVAKRSTPGNTCWWLVLLHSDDAVTLLGVVWRPDVLAERWPLVLFLRLLLNICLLLSSAVLISRRRTDSED
jgi:hypothetical protein